MKEKILVIGHKGASNISPENTLLAFRKAIELKADYIEFDIHKSLDGEIVVIHDNDTYNTTGTRGLIKEMMLKEIQELDAGEGEKIPTLNDLIKLTKGKINLQPEIKAPGLIDDLVQILRKNNLVKKTIISSFDITQLINMKEIEPALKIGYLIPSELTRPRILSRYIQKAVKNEFYAIHPHFTTISKELVDNIYANNLKINAWTVNEEEEMKRLIDLGVDGIITDDIALLNRTIRRTYQ
ncbi:MAG: glycerophosphodiester phosphodiesterase [Candidatus Lokiarchaeota archaeon]|nr:glycerophosphodiester phosphodiesterase [Candidatus Lokiarchaeota archaeon]